MGMASAGRRERGGLCRLVCARRPERVGLCASTWRVGLSARIPRGSSTWAGPLHAELSPFPCTWPRPCTREWTQNAGRPAPSTSRRDPGPVASAQRPVRRAEHCSPGVRDAAPLHGGPRFRPDARTPTRGAGRLVPRVSAGVRAPLLPCFLPLAPRCRSLPLPPGFDVDPDRISSPIAVTIDMQPQRCGKDRHLRARSGTRRECPAGTSPARSLRPRAVVASDAPAHGGRTS